MTILGMYRPGVVATLGVISLTFIVCNTAHAAADTFSDIELTAGIDDNVTRAPNDPDIEYDSFVRAAASLGHMLYAGPAGLVEVDADLKAENFFRFDGLSNVSAGARAKYTFGFSGGFGAPWFSIDAEALVVEFDSELRDSNIYRTNFTFGKDLDDRTSLRSALGYQKRDSDGKAFDTENVTFFINLDFRIKKKTLLYTTYKYQAGDIFSSVNPSNLDPVQLLNIINATKTADDGTKAIDNPDDVFPDKVAYRLDGKVHFITAGLNIARSLHSSYDLSARFLTASADDADVDYQGLTLLATYFHRFNF